MLEQELASIMKYTLDKAEKTSPYYYEVPRHFTVPAVYFPTPEITTGGETFLTYRMEYVWRIIFFHKSSHKAYALGLEVLTAIKGNRNLIPLITQTGEEAEEGGIRLDDPELKVLDSGAAQLTLSWISRRPYNDTAAGAQRSRSFSVDVFMKSGKEISDAYAEALEKYAVPLQTNGAKPE